MRYNNPLRRAWEISKRLDEIPLELERDILKAYDRDVRVSELSKIRLAQAPLLKEQHELLRELNHIYQPMAESLAIFRGYLDSAFVSTDNQRGE